MRRSGGDPSAESRKVLLDSPDDLLHLEDFNDADLLRALWTRYERKEIYTWVGSVLVSINPYKDIGAFREEIGTRYASSSALQAPHLYAIVMAALNAPGDKHALLVTGESGAGKTEATRAVLSFLAMRHTSTDFIRDRLIRSTPVLEAFGNAHTRQNTNSSRFGKFIEVHLSQEGGVIGATLQPYMLEASRVAGNLPEGERTYHVFYLLRAALGALASGAAPQGHFWTRLMHSGEWAELVSAGGAALANSQRLRSGPPDARSLACFEELVGGLHGAGMRHGEVVECCRLVAAVALLADMESGEETLPAAAALLRIPEKDIRTFLTKVETSVGVAQQERFYRTRSEREATTLRASLAQELYNALFGWLTRLVARGIAPPKKASATRMLGLLDLYGFEVFASNGFEQFLINYCNERLQQLFNRQVFTCEAQEYSDEGLDSDGQWYRLMTACQLPALALLEGELGSSLGLFSVINDRSRCGFEESGKESNALADTISASCGTHPAFCRAGRDSSRVFGVKHFAGEVFYEAAQFVRKNASANRPDIVAFLREQGGAFIREVLGGDGDGEGDVSPSAGAASSAPSASSGAVSGSRRRKLFGRTLISVFQQELNELCAALDSRNCRHVRCLRPNDDQAPLVFDDASMLRQCRYSGLLEATRIRRQGYAHRRPLRSFAARYALLLNTREARRHARHAPAAAAHAACGAIIQVASEAGITVEDARIGRSKVFLRESALVWFENTRKGVAAKVVVAVLKGRCARIRHLRLRVATLVVQAHTRGWAARRYTQWLRAQRWAEQQRAADEAAEQAAVARAEGAACRLQRCWRQRIAIHRAAARRTARLLDREAALAARAESCAAVAAAAAAAARREKEDRRERRRREQERRERELERLEREQREYKKLREQRLEEVDERDDVATCATLSPVTSPVSSPLLGGQHRKTATRNLRSAREAPLRHSAQTCGLLSGHHSKSRRLLTYNTSRTPPPAMERRRAASQQPKHSSTPRCVHRHYLQECNRLLVQHQRIRKMLPSDQHFVLGELVQAANFLSLNPPPVPYEDIMWVKERIQNLKAAIKSCAASAPSSSHTALGSGHSAESAGHHDSQPRLMQRHPSFPAYAASAVSFHPVPSMFFDIFGDRHILEPLQRSEPMQRSLSARSVYRMQSPRSGGFRSPLQTHLATCCLEGSQASSALPATARTPTTGYRTPLHAICSHSLLPPATLTPRHVSHAPPLSATVAPTVSTTSAPSTTMVGSAPAAAMPKVPVWAWQTKPPVVSSMASSATATPSKRAFTARPGHEVILSAIPTPARASGGSRFTSPMKRVTSSVTTISYSPSPLPVTKTGSVSVSSAPASGRVAPPPGVHVVGPHSATASLVPPARPPLSGARSQGSSITTSAAPPAAGKPQPAVPMSPGVPTWLMSPMLPPGTGSRCCSPSLGRAGSGGL